MRFYTAMAGLVAIISTSAHAHEPVHTLELSIGETMPYDSLAGIVSLVHAASEGAGAIADAIEPETVAGRWGELLVVGLFDGFVSCSGHEFSHASLFEKTGEFRPTRSMMCFDPQILPKMITTQDDLELYRIEYGAGYNFHAASADYTLRSSLEGGDVHDVIFYLINRFSQTGYTLAAFTQHDPLRSESPDPPVRGIVNSKTWDLEGYTMFMNLELDDQRLRRVRTVSANELAARQIFAELFTWENYHALSTLGHYGSSGEKGYSPWMFDLGKLELSPPVFSVYLSGKGPILLGSSYGLLYDLPFALMYGNDDAFLSEDKSLTHYVGARAFDFIPHSPFDLELGGSLTFWEKEGTGYSVTVGGGVPFVLKSVRIGGKVTIQRRDILERDVYRSPNVLGLGTLELDL